MHATAYLLGISWSTSSFFFCKYTFHGGPLYLKDGQKHREKEKLQVGEVFNSTMANFSLLANLFLSKFSKLLNYQDWSQWIFLIHKQVFSMKFAVFIFTFIFIYYSSSFLLVMISWLLQSLQRKLVSSGFFLLHGWLCFVLFVCFVWRGFGVGVCVWFFSAMVILTAQWEREMFKKAGG